MHEFNICQTIVDTVLAQMEQMDPPPQRLLKTNVVVGQLRQIVPEYLAFAYETLTRDTPAAGSDLVVKSSPATATCHRCGWEGPLHKNVFQCGKCGGSLGRIDGGRELYLESLEIEEHDDEGD